MNFSKTTANSHGCLWFSLRFDDSGMVVGWVRDVKGLRLWMTVGARDREGRGANATPEAPRSQTDAGAKSWRNHLKQIEND